MTIALTYLDDLSRVRIDLTAITPDGTVRVERAALTADPPWQVVRGGIELPIVAGEAQLDDYEFFADVLNWYRVLRVDPAPGLILPGVSGDNASTPDDAALDITGDIELRVDATLDSWASGASQALVGKWTETGDQRSYLLQAASTGVLRFNHSTTGADSIGVNSTEAVPVGDGERLAVRVIMDVDNGASGHTVTFYTAPTIDGPWTQLGAPVVTAGVTSIFSGSAIVTVGAYNAGTTALVAGTIDAVEVLNGINGVAAANPDFAAEDSGTLVFVDDAGRTWTINGDAEILGETIEEDSITPDLEGEVWLKSIKYPMLNRIISCNLWEEIQRPFRGGVFEIEGRSLPVALTDLRASQHFTLTVATETLAQARDFDLVLAASGVMFIHTPVEDPADCARVSAVPGGYVVIDATAQRRTMHGAPEMVWILPCRVVVPPGPEIVGTTLTWGTVERLYGSWTALWASNPTWQDLWSQIGDPEDLVVL